MTSLDELIDKRRSIRKYKTDLPSPKWIAGMIRCAAGAPSPKNSQPVRFIRISSPEARDRLCRAMAAGRQRFLQSALRSDSPKRTRNWINTYWRYSEFMFKAPLLFAVGTVSTDHGFSERLLHAGIIKKDARGDTDMDIAVGLALKGFLLKGEELGLGACILTAPLIFIQGMEKISGLKDVRIKCFVTAGFPDENPSYIERKTVTEVYREI